MTGCLVDQAHREDGHRQDPKRERVKQAGKNPGDDQLQDERDKDLGMGPLQPEQRLAGQVRRGQSFAYPMTIRLVK